MVPVFIACTFPVARKGHNDYRHKCQRVAVVRKWKGCGACSSWRLGLHAKQESVNRPRGQMLAMNFSS